MWWNNWIFTCKSMKLDLYFITYVKINSKWNCLTVIVEQAQKVTYCIIPFISNIQNRQIHRDRKQITDCQGMGEWSLEWLLNVCGIFFGGGDKNILGLERGSDHIIQWIYQTHWTVNLKMIDFILCKFNLNFFKK